MLFDGPLQEGSVYTFVFLQAQAVLADKHADHVAMFFFVNRLFTLNRF